MIRSFSELLGLSFTSLLMFALIIGCTEDEESDCGNAVIDAGEQCDGLQLGGQDCVSQGFESGELTCSSSCTFVTSACVEGDDTSDTNQGTGSTDDTSGTDDSSDDDTGSTDDTGTDDSTDSESSGPATITIAHSGSVISNGGSYNIPDGITNPDSAAVAIFSEQKDRMVITNIGSQAVTINSLTIAQSSGVMDEELEICSEDSGTNQCLEYPLGSIDPAATSDFYVHFYPVASGERTGTLTVNYTDGEGVKTYTIDLTGYGRVGSDEYPANFFSHATATTHKLWGGYSSSQDEAPGPMVLDSAGNTYFAGTGTELVGTSTSDRNIFVVKVNADQTLAWSNLYSSTNHDQISQTGDNLLLGDADAMAMDSSGYLYVVGNAANGSNTQSLGMVLKIDPSDGTVVWTRYWFGDTDRLQYTDAASAFAMDISGDQIYVVGNGKSDSSTQGITLFSLTTAGVLNWSKIIVPQGNVASAHRGHTVKADGSGNLFVAGIDYSSGASGPFIVKLSSVDAAGTSVTMDWAKTFSGETMGTNFCSMDLDSSGNAFLAMDRRGATTYFSVVKISSDGATVTGTTLPGTSGDRNNIYAVNVQGDAVYAAGRIGLSGWDTGNGDGMIAKFATADLSLTWGAVYYTGSGPNEVCHHSGHGIATNNNNLHITGQVYTGNANYYRYWGYWYDYPGTPEVFSPTSASVLSTTTLSDMTNANFVTSSDTNFDNDGVFGPIDSAMNVEFQNAEDKNENTNGAAVDGDVFIMTLQLQ